MVQAVECGKEEGCAVNLKTANHVCSSSIAIHRVKRIIGRRIKNNSNDVLLSYVIRRCSMILRRRRTVPFASFQCRQIDMLCLTSTHDYNVSTDS